MARGREFPGQMTNIFDEIEEDLRKDRARRLWEKYGKVFLAVGVLIVAVIAGWRGYQGWQASQAAATGDRFMAAMTLATRGQHAEAARAFEQLTRDGTGGYPILARFRLATELAAAGDRDGAVRAFDALAADTSIGPVFQDLARVRAGYLLVDSAPLADLTRRLEPLAAAGGAFRNSARELLGLAAIRAGDAPAAARWFEAIVTDTDAGEGFRNRAGLALTVLAGDGVTPESARSTR
jgi:hypothetical protein